MKLKQRDQIKLLTGACKSLLNAMRDPVVCPDWSDHVGSRDEVIEALSIIEAVTGERYEPQMRTVPGELCDLDSLVARLKGDFIDSICERTEDFFADEL